MTKAIIKVLVTISLLSVPVVFLGQGLDDSSILKPATDSWPTYGGDYTEGRYSILTQLNRTNAHNLTLAWVAHLTTGTGGGSRRFFGGCGGGTPAIEDGVATKPMNVPGSSGGSSRLTGLLTTAGHLRFDGVCQDLLAFNVTKLKPLWHTNIAGTSNDPETYMFDGHQYILEAASEGAEHPFYLQ